MNNKSIKNEEVPEKRMIRLREIKIAATCLGILSLSFIFAAVLTYLKLINLGDGLSPVLFSILGIFFGAATIYLCTAKEPK